MSDRNKDWIAHAYPLKQVVVKLQGTRHSDTEAVVSQLEAVLERLRSGESTGSSHDDDFGYAFELVDDNPHAPSFFERSSDEQ